MRSMRRFRGSLGLAVVAAMACSGATHREPVPGQVPPAATSTAVGAPRLVEPDGAAPAADAPMRQEATARATLALPVSEAFVAAPLPAFDPERYRSFRQTSRIWVGESHLSHVDLFPGDELLLAMSEAEALVRIYDRQTRRRVGSHAVPGFRRFETGAVAAWPEPEPRFITAGQAGLLAFDARSGEQVEKIDPRPLAELRWSPDRRILVAREAAPPQTSSVLHFFARPGSGPGIALEPVGSLSFPERVDAWDLSADNRLLALSLHPSGDLLVIDLPSGEDVLRVPGPKYCGDVALSPDGRLVAVGGQGLLLVDLLNASRRAFYSHLYNNIGHVRFSPSGDAVVASSYDGHIRIFRIDTVDRAGLSGLRLSMVQALRHEGQANVYAFVFEDGGDGIVSVSGDQTIRTFRGQARPKRAEDSSRTFHSLSDWKRLDPETARPYPPPPDAPMSEGHYVPPRLEGPARPSRIQPGDYACKVSLMYKLRDCWVRKSPEGHTLLEVGPENLLGLKGVLYDDGPVVRFEGWLTGPSTVVGCHGCERQPVFAVFRGSGTSWRGLLTVRNYHDPYVPPEPPPADVKIEEADDRFPLVLQFRAARSN